MLVKEIMSPSVISLTKTESVILAARKMRDMNVGCLLITQGKVLDGIVTDRDITCRSIANNVGLNTLSIGDIMSTPVIWCYEDEDVEEALQAMEERQIRRLPVLNSAEKLVGIMTLSDISTHMPHWLSGEAIESICLPRSTII